MNKEELRILVVEDNEANRQSARLQLGAKHSLTIVDRVLSAKAALR